MIIEPALKRLIAYAGTCLFGHGVGEAFSCGGFGQLSPVSQDTAFDFMV